MLSNVNGNDYGNHNDSGNDNDDSNGNDNDDSNGNEPVFVVVFTMFTAVPVVGLHLFHTLTPVYFDSSTPHESSNFHDRYVLNCTLLFDFIIKTALFSLEHF